MKLFAALALLCLACQFAKAHAADVRVSWVQSTQYTDGSTLPAAEITANRVAWGTCNGTAFGTKLGEHKLAPSTGDVISGLAAGKYCIMLFTTATQFGAVVSSTESDPSNVVTVMIDAPPPKKPQPPSGGAATVAPIAPTAFTLIKSQDAIVMLPVGRTNATRCDVSQAVQIGAAVYNPVPAGSVTFTGSARPIVVFALCG